MRGLALCSLEQNTAKSCFSCLFFDFGHAIRTILLMIKTFADRATQSIYADCKSLQLPTVIYWRDMTIPNTINMRQRQIFGMPIKLLKKNWPVSSLSRRQSEVQ